MCLSFEARLVSEKLDERKLTEKQLNAAYWLLMELFKGGFNQDMLFKATREITRIRGHIMEG
ncbi:MAG: hypothetical protein NUW02_00465 [Candidatus Campbellbacteria bacterium]|nr:hypothetical protein [Candidatus Campbellbacteria bacterium]